MCRHTKLRKFLLMFLIPVGISSVLADGGVKFSDIAEGDNSGFSYRSSETPTDVIWDEIKIRSFTQPLNITEDPSLIPGKSRGNPGVAIFDYDNDGDMDIYVTNSGDFNKQQGVNSLYSNQLMETGILTFVDVAAAAGVAIPDHGSTGTCFGDIDNDGDDDLYVVGLPINRLFENQGNGTFIDITASSQTAAGGQYPSSCSFGDVNGDGLLDFAIANSFDNWDHRLPLRTFNYDHLMKHNQIYVNRGANKFEDVSAASGIQNINRITWAVALVDYDLDGDLDLITADDQGPKPGAAFGGIDHGYIRTYNNDGTGFFTDVTEEVGLNQFGAWMGISFADLNRDGILDLFGTNAGDYLTSLMGPLVGGGQWSSRWALGTKDGGFEFPGLGMLGKTPFGWGTAMLDYDNDGDHDIWFAGGLDMGPFLASNPGAILQNDGNANFRRDAVTLPVSPYHQRRNVQGSAIGDLNNDGFVDIVSVSNQNWPTTQPLVPYDHLGGEFDGVTPFWPTFDPVDPANPLAGFVWRGIDPEDGTLAVMINSADNGNNSVTVRAMGTVGLTSDGRVNRSGIGAMLKFTPQCQETAMKPIVSGGSHTAASSLTEIFGLGNSSSGVLEILWPGGVRNKLYDVSASESIVFPEIPCDYSNTSSNFGQYRRCVNKALSELTEAGVIAGDMVWRLRKSAMKAKRNKKSRRCHNSHSEND